MPCIASASRSTRRSPTRAPTTQDGVVLAAAGVHVELGAIDLLGDLVPGEGPVELVADAHVNGIHGVRAQLSLGARDAAQHEVPAGEAAKATASLERLWNALRIGRDGTIVALGGGCTTDVAGFAAATYMRGVAWAAVPTSLVGQVDAAIGGKTAVDLPGGQERRRRLPLARRGRGRPVAPGDPPRRGACERDGGGREDGPAGRRAGVGAPRDGDGATLRGREGGRVPRRPARPRPPQRAQPGAHVRARARGGGRLRAAARPGRRARPARRAAPLGATRRGGRPCSACSTRSRCASTATRPGPPCTGTRRRSAGRRGSSCSMRPGEPTLGRGGAGGRRARRARRADRRVSPASACRATAPGRVAPCASTCSTA